MSANELHRIRWRRVAVARNHRTAACQFARDLVNIQQESIGLLRVQYNTIQHSLFNEGNVINPMSYLTYGLHNGTKYTYKKMPNQLCTTYYNRN